MAFISLLACAITTALSVLRRSAPRFESEYAAGIAVSFIMLAIHAYVEWVTMNSVIHALFAINLGVVIAAWATARQRGTVSPPQRPIVFKDVAEASPG